MNLYDLTKGNYRILRTITYPEFPESKIETQAQVKSKSESLWETEISIQGTYNGPTDFVATKDYQLTWARDGKNIQEAGSTKLQLASGKIIQQVWSSTITPEYGFEKFPVSGEFITLDISPFEINGNSMSYSWEGTVKKLQK